MTEHFHADGQLPPVLIELLQLAHNDKPDELKARLSAFPAPYLQVLDHTIGLLNTLVSNAMHQQHIVSALPWLHTAPGEWEKVKEDMHEALATDAPSV
jgi:hypothetical protein